MKVGDLVQDPADDDIGIVLDLVEVAAENLCDEPHIFPLIMWVSFGLDDTVPAANLEVINESR